MSRIAMVLSDFPQPSETFIVRKFLGLLSLGWDVQIICRRSEQRHLAFFPELTSDVLIPPRIYVTSDIPAALAELKPEIVHFEFGTLAIRGIDAVTDPNCRTVVSLRGYDIAYHRMNEPDAYRDVWERADAIHTVGDALWRRAIERGCPAHKRHVVITPAVDIEFFRPAPHLVSESAGAESRPLRILSIGRLHWKKGYEDALRALKAIDERGVRFEYRVIGEGEQRNAITYTADDLNLSDCVTLLGVHTRSEVRAQLEWADVLLHAAISEGFCNAALEAQAMAVPVVCTDSGALPENVSHGETGFVVRRRQPWKLADKLEILDQDAALRERFGNAGRRRVMAHFTERQQLAQFDSLYRGLLATELQAPMEG